MATSTAITSGQVLFESLFASAPDAIVVVDRDGMIDLVNAQAEKLFGYDRAELVGSAIEKLLPERYRARHQHHRTRYMGNPHLRPMGRDLELYGRRSDGSEFPIDIMLSPLAADGNDMVIAIVRDVTERKRAERALQEKNLELEQANRVKDRFLATMSHELRTPLNAIIGFTGTLLMKLAGPLTADQEKQLKTIQSSARHLLMLINDVLDLAKIESGKVEVNLVRVPCHEVLDEVVLALRPLAEAKGLEFRAQIHESQLCVQADRRAFSQIVINLVNNAIKFTERGSVTLTVGVRREDGVDYAEISVIDTGPGIRPDERNKLFQAFERLDTGRPFEGTGLGLHLSQKLALLIGGRIELESEFGKGSRFSLLLPQ